MSSDEVFQFLEQKLRTRRCDLLARLDQALSEALRGELVLVESAIARFESGDYGVCCLCLDLVELDRLQSDPVTQFCGSCADDSRR